MMHVKYLWKMHLFLQGKNYYNVNNVSNTNKVVRKKRDDVWEYEVTHWRSEPIHKLYERCCIQHPVVNNCGINYFAKFIPWFVRVKKKYSGLCWKHDLGKYYTSLLRTKRVKWHLHCDCTCVFCRQCDHGKKPLSGNCHEGSCKRCEFEECPIEWDENKQGKIF
jgi:hypothetical protein